MQARVINHVLCIEVVTKEVRISLYYWSESDISLYQI